MKKLLLAFPLLFATAYFLFRAESSARPTRQQNTKYDTITYYLVHKEHYRTNNKKEVYKVNGHVVSKSTYDKYPKDALAVFECKPCYAKVFGKDGKPIHEGHMYTDCPVGYWKAFYPGTSRVKLEGNFRRDSTGKFDTIQSENWCGIHHGTWTYYNQAGKVDSVVNYIDGKRVK